jgi:hypothetical protein
MILYIVVESVKKSNWSVGQRGNEVNHELGELMFWNWVTAHVSATRAPRGLALTFSKIARSSKALLAFPLDRGYLNED